MKRFTIFAILLFSFIALGSIAQAQTATQTVTVAVNTIYRMTLSSATTSLLVTDGTAGTDALISVSSTGLTYSITHNSKTGTTKITAAAVIAPALPTGIELAVVFTPVKGTTAGSKVLSASAQDVVTVIPRGADANAGLQYTLSATASAGSLTSQNAVITYTISN